METRSQLGQKSNGKPNTLTLIKIVSSKYDQKFVIMFLVNTNTPSDEQPDSFFSWFQKETDPEIDDLGDVSFFFTKRIHLLYQQMVLSEISCTFLR